jgi:hypothetical protein
MKRVVLGLLLVATGCAPTVSRRAVAPAPPQAVSASNQAAVPAPEPPVVPRTDPPADAAPGRPLPPPELCQALHREVLSREAWTGTLPANRAAPLLVRCAGNTKGVWATTLVTRVEKGRLLVDLVILFASTTKEVLHAKLALSSNVAGVGVDELSADEPPVLTLFRAGMHVSRMVSWLDLVRVRPGGLAIEYHPLTRGAPVIGIVDLDKDGEPEVVTKADMEVCHEYEKSPDDHGRREISDRCQGSEGPLVCYKRTSAGALERMECPDLSPYEKILQNGIPRGERGRLPDFVDQKILKSPPP